MTNYTPKPGFSFPGTPPKEAIDYFRAKDLRVGFSYEDVWGAEHAAAFTVAKAMQLDVLDDIREAVDDALANGKTYRQFAKELKPLLVKKGWWGIGSQIDPQTGEEVEVRLGSARRLQTIYRANLRSARAAGQWERIQRTKALVPYLLYGLGPSEHHRQLHESWAGTLLHADDSWWRDHYPPNGWGCKCWVRQISKREAERRGGVTARPPRDEVAYVNKRTGEVSKVDRGLDPAWASNPGMDRLKVLREQLAAKADGTDYRYANAAVRAVTHSAVLDDWLKKPDGEIPVAVVDPVIKSRLKADKQVVRLSRDTMEKQTGNHRELTPSDYRVVPALIRGGIAIDQGGGRVAYFDKVPGGKWYKAVIKHTSDGRWYLVTLYQTDARELRRDRRRGKVIRSVVKVDTR